MPTKPSKTLETFDNPNPERDYLIQITLPEFTCLCPKTGQPDFATLYLDYIADRQCIELKSLKLYVWSFRNEGAFHEAVTNQILSDLVAATAPRYMQLKAEFNVRGGIYTTVVVEYRKPGWQGGGPGSQPKPAVAPQRPPVSTPSATPRADSTPPGSGRFRMLQRARTEPAAASAEPEPEPEPEPAPEALFVGLDLGTSACSAAAVDRAGQILALSSVPIPVPPKSEDQATQDPGIWWKAATACLQALFREVDAGRVRAITVDATSGTILLCDKKGEPLTPALMYNDSRAQAQAKRIAGVAARDSGAHGASGSLAKLLWLHDKQLHKKAAHCLHQADWIIGKLCGEWGVSDYNNCLKLGYDAHTMQWPEWIARLGVEARLLPQVQAPGTLVGTVSPGVAKALGLRPDTAITAGTTDGVAAFVAAGAAATGDGVTSLGSTLVLKLLSDRPVFSPEHGVYSHRLGERWLVGGASNAGGAALLQYFSVEQMREMTPFLDPEQSTGLEYYPLPSVGERFPVADPKMLPVTEPLPGDSVTFFQGMLEGIARIEAQGYRLLAELGAPQAKQIFTTGGGSENLAWQRIRERTLGVRMREARSQHACVGAALIAAGMEAGTTERRAAKI